MEMKFRGIDIKTGEMVFGGGIDSQRDTPIIINHGVRYFVDAKTVGMFTGLKDKNSVEIYAGDIFFDGIENCTIEWCDNSASFIANDGTEKHELGEWTQRELIIGNIHQNPELLEP